MRLKTYPPMRICFRILNNLGGKFVLTAPFRLHEELYAFGTFRSMIFCPFKIVVIKNHDLEIALKEAEELVLDFVGVKKNKSVEKEERGNEQDLNY